MRNRDVLKEARRRHRKQAEEPFLIARAEAIFAYSFLENALAYLFAALLQTDDYHVAGIVFWRILNNTSRNQILQKLMIVRYGSTYNKFFPSFIRFVRKLDETRNKIVHWNVEVSATDRRVRSATVTVPFTLRLILTPPDSWELGELHPGINLAEIRDFEARACSGPMESRGFPRAFG